MSQYTCIYEKCGFPVVLCLSCGMLYVSAHGVVSGDADEAGAGSDPLHARQLEGKRPHLQGPRGVRPTLPVQSSE